MQHPARQHKCTSIAALGPYENSLHTQLPDQLHAPRLTAQKAIRPSFDKQTVLVLTYCGIAPSQKYERPHKGSAATPSTLRNSPAAVSTILSRIPSPSTTSAARRKQRMSTVPSGALPKNLVVAQVKAFSGVGSPPGTTAPTPPTR